MTDEIGDKLKNFYKSLNLKLSDIQNDLNKKQQMGETLLKEVVRLRTVIEREKKLLPKFLECSPEIRTFRDKIYEEIELFTDSAYSYRRDAPRIYIMGYFDQILIDKLLPVAKYIKIIHRKKKTQQKY